MEQTGDVTPPAETFTFVLEDVVNEGETERNLADYGITLVDDLKISTATGNESTKTFAVQIGREKVKAENGWHGYGNNTPSAPLRWYSKSFLLKEVDDGKAGWQYSTKEYAVTFEYDTEYQTMDLSIHTPGNDDYSRSAEFKNTYTGTTVAIPFTKTVKLGGNTAPGKTDFTLEIFDIGNGTEANYKDVTYTAAVTTTGAGSFDGKLIISGPSENVSDFVSEGFYVREVNDGLPKWTYSDAVWYVSREGKIFPARMETTDNGDFYDAINNADAVGKMTFVNIYTRNTSYTTPDEKPISSPKTFDAGVALYGVSALLSLTGTALVIKRKNG